jgi:hypothetical protein
VTLNTSLINGLQLESQYLQSYDAPLEIFRPNYEGERRNFANIEKTISKTCILSKLIMQFSKMIFVDSAIFIKKTVANRLL